MPTSEELARRLYEYDERLAEDILALIGAQLGGPVGEGRGIARIRFARAERLRTLGLALAQLVSPAIGR
jgi:hypothetical protein